MIIFLSYHSSNTGESGNKKYSMLNFEANPQWRGCHILMSVKHSEIVVFISEGFLNTSENTQYKSSKRARLEQCTSQKLS